MATAYVLYNPLAGDGKGEEEARLLEIVLQDAVLFFDMTKVTNYGAFLNSMEPEDYLVIVGGDGTLNRFVNDTNGLKLPSEILYFPGGTGNDFACDLGQTDCSCPFSVARYLETPPTVEVKGKQYRFLNGVGFGIDGYCCQVGDEQRKISRKKVNYTAIAIKGLLRSFAPRNAKVTVDGNTYEYKNVWIAPTMLGRFYGGGMMPAPQQDRHEGTLTLMLFYGASRLRTLRVFPGIFKGTHVKHTDMVALHRGHEISVEFDSPTPLQIDGETILNVTRYTARSGASEEGNCL
jgi:diacylglycerol kinase family enzyme